MKEQLSSYIKELEAIRNIKTEQLSKNNLSDYNRSYTIHTYNQLCDIIPRLKQILNS